MLSNCGPAIEFPDEIEQSLPEFVDYNHHVKPILSDRCFACHGPDAKQRKSGLRLDTEEGAFSALDQGGRAIIKGSPRRSKIIQRVLSHDPSEIMPPIESNLVLSEREKALLVKWIDQGAEWKDHWSFVSPKKTNELGSIDDFVQKQLYEKDLDFSPKAKKEVLIRRLSFDLTGLPPSIDEIDVFVDDDTEDAYERLVDRLLESPSYGERLANEWMDVARYADSHGYHADGYRLMWPWRDWVIKSFNDNRSYKDFGIWQLAGDLLPNASKEQRLATAFNRNHQQTAEGGVVPEEYRLEYVFDRVNTTSKAFMGVTMECARCHDHKYDPISQKEFYQFAAYFNNQNEVGLTADDGNAGPMMLLTDDAVDAEIEFVEEQIKYFEKAKVDLGKTEEKTTMTEIDWDKQLKAGLVAYYPLDEINEKSTPNLVNRSLPATFNVEPSLISGKENKAFLFADDYDFLVLPGQGQFERFESFSSAMWVKADSLGDFQELIGNAHQKNTYWRGWEFFIDSLGHASLSLIHALPHNRITVRSQETIQEDRWTHLGFSYDGSSKGAGIRIFIDGKLSKTEILYDRLYKSILPIDYRYNRTPERPLRMARSYRAFGGDDGIYKGSIDEVRLYKRELLEIEMAFLSGLESRTVSEVPNTFDLRQRVAYKEVEDSLNAYRVRQNEIMAGIDEIMVMEELPTARKTYILDRGVYDSPLEEVQPYAPGEILEMEPSSPDNRLGLAEWLFSSENPLTARVTVNRYWQMIFGRGLVETADDFGLQGSLPSHPELLDWLALSFVERGWDLKWLLKEMVMSDTYQQSSKASPEAYALDPNNVWLSRGSSYRLSAEMIRDNVLAASGLLVEKLGGESVRPYQPKGLWKEKGTYSPALLDYNQSTGEGLYRRSMYTFIKRTSPPPSMTIFDAPDRTICEVKRQKTNTPLQALVLMNDPQYVEASRVIAEKMIESGELLPAQLQHGFRRLTGRMASDEELRVLGNLYSNQKERFQSDPSLAVGLLQVGEYQSNRNYDPVEIASLAVVANTIINHDASYSRR